jgi:hypothetical protein
VDGIDAGVDIRVEIRRPAGEEERLADDGRADALRDG